MAAYTFRINEINVFYYQQKMVKKFKRFRGPDKKDQSISEEKNSENNKFVKYIKNNYAILSFKVALYVITDAVGLTNAYESLKAKWNRRRSDKSNKLENKEKVEAELGKEQND